MSHLKRTWAEINLDNLEYNYKKIREKAGESVKFLGVVKANAYGHGALRISKTLARLGADYLAVSSLDEAEELRLGDVKLPILIFGHTPPEQVDKLLKYDITQTVTCEAKALEYQAQAEKLGGKLKIHIKLDTGMSRLGFLCGGVHFDDCIKAIIRSCKLKNLEAEGIFTHFAVSDEEGEENKAYTKKQFDLFMSVISKLSENGINFKIRHCANSGAFANYPETYLDMVRPGLLTYGYGEYAERLGLKPVMSVKTVIGTIKVLDADTSISYGRLFTTDTCHRVGVLPIGYADGLFRSFSNGGTVQLPYGKTKILGRICMDMCMIDLKDYPQSEVGDEVEIFGENNPVEEVSAYVGTIPYEIVCAVSRRVPRLFLEKGEIIEREIGLKL